MYLLVLAADMVVSVMIRAAAANIAKTQNSGFFIVLGLNYRGRGVCEGVIGEESVFKKVGKKKVLKSITGRIWERETELT